MGGKQDLTLFDYRMIIGTRKIGYPISKMGNCSRFFLGSQPSHSSLIYRSHIGQCGAGCFSGHNLHGAGSLVASVVQTSGSCSQLRLNDTNSVSWVALSSDVSLNSSCLRPLDALLADEFSSIASYTIRSASSCEESKGVTWSLAVLFLPCTGWTSFSWHGILSTQIECGL